MWIAGCDTPRAAPDPQAQLDARLDAVRLGMSEELDLSDLPIDEAVLARVGRLEPLVELRIEVANRLPHEALRHLHRLPNLRRVHLGRMALGDEHIELLLAWPKLTVINVTGTRLTAEGIARLRELPQLELLRIGSDRLTDRVFDGLAEFPALRFVHLLDAPITDEGLIRVVPLKRLESLYLDRTLVTDAGIDALERVRPDLHIHTNTAPD